MDSLPYLHHPLATNVLQIVNLITQKIKSTLPRHFLVSQEVLKYNLSSVWISLILFHVGLPWTSALPPNTPIGHPGGGSAPTVGSNVPGDKKLLGSYKEADPMWDKLTEH